ncbi:ATP-binding protein [Lutimaribacter sp. EGI FJ00015]|uniref:ATP-binding protein n=1 Tax=Lutimaribacter degradans TaxID=2945989 RepID=A0ACC5ZRV7_9RHOB|nr:ATP-binding protein [Lutimaribacter sp. EGI FJ00013]MCM2560905.1 ATP-binding protein [Lutimaribacter sp. EGI FJ00013]MCO0612150.1 ATP-binding protein [Lutimaribacter sp. EGI FJ00015]MCO0634730.1 ATP-binding protein [Lutimaribacter sp. EGI FJ00014]
MNLLVAVCLGYVALLFLVAFVAERAALRGRGGWLRSPVVYTLSLSIYCTAWTFYGAVGYAARSGLEYLTIYLGPTLVMIGWWWGLRKLVRIGRTQRVTSVADLISSRYGKSTLLAVFVTLIAVIGTTPYIALQLQSVTASFASIAQADPNAASLDDNRNIALWVAAGLALFTILFGTRNLDANERHHGVVMAIAVEAVVKLAALMAVGVFVVWGLGGGLGETLARIDASARGQWQVDGARWAGLTFLAAAAFLTLPRMFQVLVVENEDEGHLRTASWAFPLYLMLISLFVVPIAVVGLEIMPAGSNPDQFVLTVPLSQGQNTLAMLSFLGGFSSATSMVIVASIALATMVSNHIVMPIWLRLTGGGAVISGDVRHVVILSRRVSIAAVLGFGYLYYRLSGGGAALAAIGLISFAGVAQFLPALLGGILWRGATRTGALVGLSLGFVLWVWCLLLPSFGTGVVISESVMAAGPWGIGWLRPYALFGLSGVDPLVHAIVWTMLFNAGGFTLASLISFPTPLERLQGAQFVNVFQHSGRTQNWAGDTAQSEDLMVMAQRILGPAQSQALFQEEARRQGLVGYLPEPSPDFLARLERELSGSVGAATAHAMVGQIMGAATVSVDDLLAVADETAQMMEYSSQLEAKSEELTRTARQLRAANEKLTQLSVQKDAFLSQISHELRTPMTSIRAFSEILRDGGALDAETRAKYADIIHGEAIRLTRLLDDLLDLSVLENGQVNLNLRTGVLAEVIDHAVAATGVENGPLRLVRDRQAEEVMLETDLDRLAQVFINLIANARKYCDAAAPRLTVSVQVRNGRLMIDFVDNGTGIPRAAQALVFEKFSRVSDQNAGGAGLGLAICREIMARLDGSITYLPGQGGAAFRVTLPVAQRVAAQ